MSEILWKPLVHPKITGESGYLVSNTGLIKRLERRLDYDDCYVVYKEKIITPSKHITGYLNIKLQVWGLKIYDSVHRLVAFAFIPNPNNYNCINHLDNDKTNNHVDNLEWTTHHNNMLHYYDLITSESTFTNDGNLIYPPLDISKLKNNTLSIKQYNLDQAIGLKIYDLNNSLLHEIPSKGFLYNSGFLTKSQYKSINEKLRKKNTVTYRGFVFELVQS